MAKATPESTANQKAIKRELRTLRSYISAASLDADMSSEHREKAQTIARNLWEQNVVFQLKNALLIHNFPTLLQHFEGQKTDVRDADALMKEATRCAAQKKQEHDDLENEYQTKKAALLKDLKKQINDLKTEFQTAHMKKLPNDMLDLLAKHANDKIYQLERKSQAIAGDHVTQGREITPQEKELMEIHSQRAAAAYATEAINDETARLKQFISYGDIAHFFSFNNLENLSPEDLQSYMQQLVTINKDFLEKITAQNSKRSKEVSNEVWNNFSADQKQAFRTEWDIRKKTENSQRIYVLGLQAAAQNVAAVNDMFSANKNANQYKKQYLFLAASVAAITLSAVLLAPAAIAIGAVIGAVLGMTGSMHVMMDGRDAKRIDPYEGMLLFVGAQMFGIPIGAIVGAVAAIPVTMAGAAHYIKRTTNESYKEKTNVLYAIEELEHTIDNPQIELDVSGVVDKYVRNLYHAHQEKMELSRAARTAGLDPSMLRDLKLLFKLRLEEANAALESASAQKKSGAIRAINNMVISLENDFDNMLRIFREINDDDSYYQPEDIREVIETNLARDSRDTPIIHAYLQNTNYQKEKESVINTVRNKLDKRQLK